MTSEANGSRHLDHLFSNSAARLDWWRDLNAKAQTWAAEARSGKSRLGGAPVQEAFANLRPHRKLFRLSWS